MKCVLFARIKLHKLKLEVHFRREHFYSHTILIFQLYQVFQQIPSKYQQKFNVFQFKLSLYILSNLQHNTPIDNIFEHGIRNDQQYIYIYLSKFNFLNLGILMSLKSANTFYPPNGKYQLLNQHKYKIHTEISQN
jgi:hypothetical protein